MPLGCYSFCRGVKGPPSCCLPFPSRHPNRPSVCVCECLSVCRSKIAELSQWGDASQVCVYVCLCRPIGWDWSKLREMDWHGRPRQGFWGEDERVPSHTCAHTHSLSRLSLSLLLDALFIYATWVSLTHVHMQTQAWDMHNYTPTLSFTTNTHMDKPKKILLFTICT